MKGEFPRIIFVQSEKKFICIVPSAVKISQTVTYEKNMYRGSCSDLPGNGIKFLIRTLLHKIQKDPGGNPLDGSDGLSIPLFSGFRLYGKKTGRIRF